VRNPLASGWEATRAKRGTKSTRGYSTKTASRDVENIPATGLRAPRRRRRDDTVKKREREREREGEAGKGENLPFVFSRARSFSFLCSSGKHLVHLGGVNALALVPALETRRSTNDDPFADKADNENIILRACDAPGRLVSGRLSRRLRSSDHGRRRKRIAHNRV